MNASARESLYGTLSRISGLALVIVCVLFQRRGLLDWSELVFLGVCVALQESFIRLPKLRLLRTPMLVLYSMLPLALVLFHAQEIHSKSGDFVQIVLYTPLPLILVSVQIMVLYVRDSSRLVSVVLVLALFSTVIGVRRPLDDSVWPWLALIGACASVFLMLQHPAMLFNGVYVTRRRSPLPPSGRPGGIMRGAFFSVVPLFTVMVLGASLFLYFSIPRLEAGETQQQGYQIGADPANPTGNGPSTTDNRGNGPRGRQDPRPENRGPASVSGLSNGVDLGDFGEIKRTNTPALDVKLVVPSDDDFVQQVYLRAFTYGTFDGYRWAPIPTPPVDIHEITDGIQRELTDAPRPAGTAWSARRYSVTLREAGVGQGGELPVPTEAWALRDVRGKLYYDSKSGSVRAPLAAPGLSYDVMVNALTASEGQLRRTFAGSSASLPPADEYLQVPVGLKEEIQRRFKFYSRYRAMAEGQNQGRAIDRGVYACALDIVKMFREATAADVKAWTYSLDFRPKPGPDSIARFLDTNTNEAERFGHCEYFASAMCILLRCYGIPARVAAGFLAMDADIDGVFHVTGRSAHAWVEVYFDRVGWVAFDPTPPEDQSVGGGGDDVSPDETETPPETPEDAVEGQEDDDEAASVSRDWLKDYDHTAQKRMFSDAAAYVSGLVQKIEDALASVTGWMPDNIFPQSSIMRVACLTLPPLVALFFWLMRRRKRKKIEARVLRQMGEGGKKKQRGLYFQLLLLLAKYGYQKRPSETPREFAQRVMRRGGDRHLPVRDLTEIYYALRFGLDRELEAEFKRELTRYAETLRTEDSRPSGRSQPA
ncbi:MAG: DUF3488 domain-containing protein [Planctomycetes bacterium]|nr:DUF3488 domain-containing protein [Planctomycetota bacterium]